jgi:DNA-binding HxlR family transcriptional regulator
MWGADIDDEKANYRLSPTEKEIRSHQLVMRSGFRSMSSRDDAGGGVLRFEIARRLLGDRWSLLILRDMVLREFRSFKELLESGEGIATNILSRRLRKLLDHGILTVERNVSDRRKLVYSLIVKGIDLAPVLTEMVLWNNLEGAGGAAKTSRSQ